MHLLVGVSEMCFWPAKTRKILENFEMHTCFDLVLKYGSDKNEWNWLQLLFHFIVLIGIDAPVIGMNFFSAVFQVLDWSFLVLHFDGNVCNWIPEVIWPRRDRVWGFRSKLASSVDFKSVWTEICKDCSIVTRFWRHHLFLMLSLRGILVCSSKMLVIFAVGFCNIDW